MADIIALTALAVGLTGSIVGGTEQHRQQKANSRMQEEQLNYNRRREEVEAKQIEQETAENVRRQREQNEYFQSQQRALLGKSGAAMTSGSPLALLGQTASDAELQVQDVHRYGYNQAQQHREQGKMFGYQAGVARAQRPTSSGLGWKITSQIGAALGSPTGSEAAAAGLVAAGDWVAGQYKKHFGDGDKGGGNKGKADAPKGGK